MSKTIQILFSGKDQLSSVAGKVEGSMRGVGNQAKLLMGTLGGLTAGFGLFAGAKGILSVTSQMENLEVSFGTMLRSGVAAKSLMKEITGFAAATPYETEELADATKKLLAFGVAQDKIIPTMRRLGDIASGLGIPIGELAELYGKAKVQGRLFAEDVNQLTGRGIPVIAEFAKQFGVADSEVRKLVETGKIGFPQLEKAIAGLTEQGGMFEGGMKRLSETLSGQWSGVTDDIKLIAADIGTSILPAMKELVATTKEWAAELKEASGWLRGGKKGAVGEGGASDIMTGLKLLLDLSTGKVNAALPNGRMPNLFGDLTKGEREAAAKQTRERRDAAWRDNAIRFNEADMKRKQQFMDAGSWDRLPQGAGGNMVDAFMRGFIKFGELQNKGREGLKAGIFGAEQVAGNKWLAHGLRTPVEELKDALKLFEIDKGKIPDAVFNRHRNDMLWDIKEAEKEERKKAMMRAGGLPDKNSLGAVESRFLTRGTNSISPMVREQQKTNAIMAKLARIAEENKQRAIRNAFRRGDFEAAAMAGANFF